MSGTLARYFHTVRHLRAVQVYGRAWFRLARPRVDARPAPALAERAGDWEPFAWRAASLRVERAGPAAPEGEGRGEGTDGAPYLAFLGVERAVRAAGDWDDPQVPKLWRYNLHYFDDLNALDARARRDTQRALIARWIAENAPGQGSGWEPYPISLRAVNWIKGDLAARAAGDAPLLDDRARDSLATQLRWLGGRLERHLLGNHLWANAKALVAGGTYFGGAEGDRWLATGARLFVRELHEQVLPDGGHFERSPMYHATMLEDVLDLLALARAGGARFPAELRQALERAAPHMLRWLRVMTHPDGRIAFFNDAAFGIAPEVATLEGYARALGVPVDARELGACEVLRESGYVRLANARAVVICDIAPVGPDHLPAHAHADTLSFELSVDGERLLVNGGTSTYDPGAERQRQRGTAAHNTVVVDGADSSEVWGTFRVARRARAQLAEAGARDGVAFAEGEHDGYRRLPGRVTHRRRWELRAHELVVSDGLTGAWREARAHFLVAPGRSAAARLTCEPDVPIVHEPAAWHPEFGRSVRTTRLAAGLTVAGRLTTTIAW